MEVIEAINRMIPFGSISFWIVTWLVIIPLGLLLSHWLTCVLDDFSFFLRNHFGPRC